MVLVPIGVFELLHPGHGVGEMIGAGGRLTDMGAHQRTECFHPSAGQQAQALGHQARARFVLPTLGLAEPHDAERETGVAIDRMGPALFEQFDRVLFDLIDIRLGEVVAE